MDNMTQAPMPVQQGSKNWPMFIVGILVGVAIGAGGYSWYQQMQPKTTNPVATSTTVSSTTANPAASTPAVTTPSPTLSSTAVSIPAGWQTATNTAGHYTVAYPADWQQSTSSTVPADIMINSPATVASMKNAKGDGPIPDFSVRYYETVGQLVSIDATTGKDVSGFKSLADYAAAIHNSNNVGGKTEPRTIGIYSGYFTNELPGIGGTNDLMFGANGHVYDLAYSDANQQSTIDQIVATFRVTQ